MARSIIQQCDLGKYKVHNYLSVGGPQQGVQLIPSCFTGIWCDIINFLSKQFVQLGIIQDFVAPAGYFRETQDKIHYDIYLALSRFLPYINNEKSHDKAEAYKERFTSLNRLGLLMFLNDTIVYPMESEHFGEMNSKGEHIEMRNTPLYQEDWIGVKTLDDQNKVYQYEYFGDHLRFNDTQILNDFVPFLYKKDYAPKEQAVGPSKKMLS